MQATEVEARNLKPVVFSGTTGEYFRIWIVNIALTLVTLGIYSAWATVRTRRYFYTQTSINDSNFDFHARPQAILFGRVIAAVAFGAYLWSGALHPFAPLGIALLVFAAIPWLVVRSRIFRLRNSSYRGIRFNFAENYADSFKAYYGGALVTLISLGLAAPTAIYWRNRFAVANSAFGKTRFSFDGEHETFYVIVYTSIGLTLLAVLGMGALAAAVAYLMPDGVGVQPGWTATVLIQLISVIYLFVYFAIWVYLQVRIRNHVWNKTTLGENVFVSALSVRSMLGIYLTNMLAIVFTLGLMVPWATIRLARYRAEHTSILLAEDWERYVASDSQAGSAIGDELGEAFDVGVDIGI